MATKTASLNQAAQTLVQALMAWVDLAITILEKLALLGLVVMLLGTVAASFSFINLPFPTAQPLTLAYLGFAWVCLKGRFSLAAIFE